MTIQERIAEIEKYVWDDGVIGAAEAEYLISTLKAALEVVEASRIAVKHNYVGENLKQALAKFDGVVKG